MSGPDRTADELALRRLATVYAGAADRHDREGFADVFLADGRLVVYRSPDADRPATERTGRDQLAEVPGMLARRYRRTFHLLGQGLYDVGDDEATGEVYCLAHHLDGDGRDTVLHMRYQDTYRRDERGEWKIAERVGVVDWTEVRTAADQPDATARTRRSDG